MSEEPRNAGVQQTKPATELTNKSTELTKRNADFMYRLTKELKTSTLDDAQQQAAILDTKTQLLAGQKTGKTAKQLFGTPTQRVQDLVEGPKKAKIEAQNNNLWIRALDNALIFMALFAAMYAVMMFIQPMSIEQTPGQAGILAIILTSAVGGLGIGYVYQIMGPNQKKRPSIWKQGGIMVLAVVLWIFFYMSFAALPKAINPMLPAYGYIILASAAFAGRWYVRRKFHIVGGMF